MAVMGPCNLLPGSAVTRGWPGTKLSFYYEFTTRGAENMGLNNKLGPNLRSFLLVQFEAVGADVCSVFLIF